MEEINKPANNNISLSDLTTNPFRDWARTSVQMMVTNLEHNGVPKDIIVRELNIAWQALIIEFDLTDHSEKNISLALMHEAQSFITDRQKRISACFEDG